MLNTFAGLEMGQRALNAFRLGIQTAGHNISNVNTEGYSRQRVNLATTFPYDYPTAGQVGTGVKATDIIRIRDEFLDYQYRLESQTAGYWEKINEFYNTLQVYFAEPGGEGVSSALNSFWSSLNDLQVNPESIAIRETVVQNAKTLGNMLDNLINNMDNYASSVNKEIRSAVDEANTILYEIASLNKQIAFVQASEQNPNDLLDKRDLLLDKLSKMIDIDIQEPFQNGDLTGEFFVTLNGRTLVQGDKVRELVAHAFEWGGKVYYDVQVLNNEFDIVEDPRVALALATGPEGVHQLVVDRISNGGTWSVGGSDARCLNPNGSLKNILTSQTFANGIVAPSGDTGTYNFDITSGDYTASFTVTGSGTDWTVTATITGPGGTVVGTYTGSPIDNNGSGELVLSELADEMRNAFASVSPVMDDVSVSVNGNTLSVTSDVNTVLYSVPSGGTDLLGMISDYVYMRTRPASTTDALGILGSFRIQVGSQGTQVMSKYVGANVNGAGFTEGDILGPGTAGETYTFRIGVDDYEANITVAWNDTTQLWEMSCDAVVTPATPVTSATNFFTVSDIANYLGTVLPTTGTSALEVGRGSSPNGQFYLKSTDNHLISIADVKGDLAAKMGMVNPNPVITIDIEETDSLETIRNKINEKYQEEYGLTAPEQWVHASLAQASDQSWYLTIASDVPGEAQRITLMGDESGNIQPLLRLGLLNTVEVGSGQYRYVTAISQKAEDASFTFNGVRYLSSDNTFSQARRIPSSTSRYDYSASTLETVSEGLWLELKSVGQTAITVRHHVQDGTIKGMEDIRDGLIQDLKGGLDELAWELVNNFNAYQYAGYGIGDALNTTGTAFFEPLTTKAGAASRLGVSSAISGNVNLIGAAMGQLDASGRAIYGTSAGSGSGSNAARMTAMQYGQLLAGGTASFGEYYNGYLSKIGSEAGRAALMSRTQSNLVANIDEQRQAVMGVNIDEEMLDLLKWNTAYNAMARYVTTIDEMLDRIINGFGLVGR